MATQGPGLPSSGDEPEFSWGFPRVSRQGLGCLLTLACQSLGLGQEPGLAAWADHRARPVILEGVLFLHPRLMPTL